MQDAASMCTVQLQIYLNRRLYETGVITYELFAKVNELLLSKLETMTAGFPAS